MNTNAMQLALEALKLERPYLGPMPSKTIAAIKALEEALAKQEQNEPKRKWEGQIDNDEFFESLKQEQGEPVAYDVRCDNCGGDGYDPKSNKQHKRI